MSLIKQIKQFIKGSWVDFTLDNSISNLNLINGDAIGSLEQKNGKASATGEGAVALNGGYKVKDDGTVTEGVRAFGKWSIAGGKDTEAYQRCAVAIGGGNKAGLTLEEFNEKYPTGTDSHGKTYEESYSFATAEGVDNKATGYGAHAENERNTASGKNSHASGQETEATGNMSFSTGYKTYATASKSFTMGDNTYAEGVGAFAQGYGGHAKGNWSTVLGESCETTKDSAIAGGKQSKATGVSSLAFGGLGISAEQKPTKAGNEYAIALGRGAQATGLYQSTAIGLDVTASGNASLAMGWNSKATELSSIAIGQDCESNGTRSMTVGWGNKTNISNQFVCGTFAEENTSNALFVVGNGGNSNSRSNAFKVLKDGRAKILTGPTEANDIVRLIELSNYYTRTEVDKTCVKKASTPTEYSAVYAIDREGNDITVSYSPQVSTHTIAQRGVGGTLFIGEPTDDKHATTKKYVDETCIAKTDGIESATTYRDYLETFNLGANAPLTGTTYTYTKNADGISYAVSCSNKSTCKIATIPSTYTVSGTAYPVTHLADNAFKDCPELLEVRIPDSVISVGASAFENCPKLQRVDFGNGLQTIGDSMFKSSGLKSIKIPETITSIGVNAFDSCTALTEIFMLSPTPPVLADASVFDNTPLAKIYVFPEYENAYKNAENWGPYADKIVADRLKLEFMFMSESLARYCRDNFFPRINTAQQSKAVCELPLIIDKDRTTTMVIQNSNILGFNVVSSSGGYNFAIGVASDNNIERRVDRATIGPTNLDKAIYYGITGRKRPTGAPAGQEITYGNQIELNEVEQEVVQTWIGIEKTYCHLITLTSENGYARLTVYNKSGVQFTRDTLKEYLAQVGAHSSNHWSSVVQNGVIYPASGCIYYDGGYYVVFGVHWDSNDSTNSAIRITGGRPDSLFGEMATAIEDTVTEL